MCALLALGACKVDVTVHVEVKSDGSGTVTLTAIADAAVVAQAPGLAEDLRFEDAVAAGWTVTGPTATDDGGLQVVLTHDFATVAEATALLQSINGAGGPLHNIAITRTADSTQTVTSIAGTLRVDGDLRAFADSDLLGAIGGSPYAAPILDEGLSPTDAVSFTFTADLPGEAIAVNGTTPESSSWTVPLDGTSADLATSTVLVKKGGGIWGTVSTVALIALIAWCIFAIAFIVIVAKARRRRARAAANNAFRVRPLTRR